MMKDEAKTKKQLIDELVEMRQRIAELEEERMGSGERLKRLFEFAPDAYYLNDLKGNFVDGNRAAEELIGYKREELIGKNFLKLKLLPPQQIPKAAAALAKNVLGQPTGPDEFMLNRKDGYQFTVEIRTAPIKIDGQDLVLGIARDITARKQMEEALRKAHDELERRVEERTKELLQVNATLQQEIAARKQAEETLRESKEQWRSLVENIPDIILTVDREGTVLFINQTMAGVDVEEMIGTSVYNYVPLEYQAMLRDYSERAFKTEESSGFEIVGLRAKGDSRWYMGRIGAIKREGQVVTLIIIASDITGRKRLEEQLNTIHDLGQELTLQHDETTIIRRVLEMTVTVLRSEIAVFGLVDEARDKLHYYNGIPASEGPSLPLAGAEPRGISVAVFHSGQALNIPDVTQDPRYVPLPGDLVIRSELCVPLRINQRVIGVLDAESSVPDYFTPDDQLLLQTLADQAAVALENAQLHAETEGRARQLAVLHELDQIITVSLHVNEVYNAFAHHIARLFPYDRMTITMVEEGDRFSIVFAVGGGEALPPVETRLPVKSSIIGWVVSQAQPLLLDDDTSNMPFPQDVLRTTTEIHSSMVIPLRIKGEVIGTWNIGSQEAGTYRSNDLEIALSFADQLAIAIENARLFETEQSQRRRIEAMQTAGAVVSSSLELTEILIHLLEESEKVIPSESSAIFLLEGDMLRCAAIHGVLDPAVIGQQFPRTEFNTIIEQTQQPLILADVQAEPRFQLMGNDHICSWMGVPLLARGRFIGYFTLDHSRPGIYNQIDAQIAMSFAHQAAIAVENARLYQDLQNQMQMLQETQAQLVRSEKMAALGRLSASIAHEINNPLQAIQNVLALLEEEIEGSGYQERLSPYLDIAEVEIDRISDIMHHMRSFYRSDTEKPTDQKVSDPLDRFYGLVHAEWQSIDLNALLEHVLSLADKQLQDNNITVEPDLATNLLLLRGNLDHLTQVFLNLVLNAIEAMADQGGILYVTARPDQMQLDSGQLWPAIRLEFGDTGVGIPAEALSRLFEPFFSTKENGSGLGLSISYKIIQAHQGQISVESQVGLGTTFTILLPVEQNRKPVKGDS